MSPAPVVPDIATIPNTIPAPMQSQLVAELSEQITATLIKAVGNAEGAASPGELGRTIAQDIIQSAQDIVASIDLSGLGKPITQDTGIEGIADAVLAEVADLPASILGATGLADADGAVAGIADDVLGATSGIADEVLAEVAGIPSTILADGIGSLAGIPSALLGSDGAAGSDGLLSAVFYPDGAAEGLSIPDLSEGAASAVADIGSESFGLLGLSYTETHDHPGGTGSGLNALSIL